MPQREKKNLNLNLSLKEGGEGGGEEEGGKISPTSESIGQRPLWGCCSKNAMSGCDAAKVVLGS